MFECVFHINQHNPFFHMDILFQLQKQSTYHWSYIEDIIGIRIHIHHKILATIEQTWKLKKITRTSFCRKSGLNNTVFAHLPQRLPRQVPGHGEPQAVCNNCPSYNALSKDTGHLYETRSRRTLSMTTLWVNCHVLPFSSTSNDFKSQWVPWTSNYFKLQKVHDLFQAPGCFVIPGFHVPTSSTSLQYRLLGCCHSPQISYWRHLKYGASIATATWRDLQRIVW